MTPRFANITSAQASEKRAGPARPFVLFYVSLRPPDPLPPEVFPSPHQPLTHHTAPTTASFQDTGQEGW